MPICGSFKAGKEIAYSDQASLFTAFTGGGANGQVIKIWRTFTEEEAQEILQRIAVQKEIAAGCPSILPVLDHGLEETGAPYSVMPGCPLSVRRMIEAQSAVPSSLLHTIVMGVLEALEEMSAKRTRPHGHLSPGNILLTPTDKEGQKYRVALSDPDLSGDSYKDDLFTLGRIIYQVVRRTERVPQHLNPPIERTVEWDYLGDEAAGWLEICNLLLATPATADATVLKQAGDAVHQFAHRTAARRRKRELLRTAGLIGAAVLAVSVPVLVWEKLHHGGKTAPQGSFGKADFEQLAAREKSDETLSKHLAEISRTADGSAPIAAVDEAFSKWVADGLQPAVGVLNDAAIAQLQSSLTDNVNDAVGPGKDQETLDQRLATARLLFVRARSLRQKRAQVDAAAGPILSRPEPGIVQFIDGWLRSYLRPADSLDEAEARLDRASADLPSMAEFLRTQWPDVRQEEFRSALASANPSGQMAVRDWVSIARRFVRVKVVTAPPTPTPAPNGKGGPAPDPLAAPRARFRTYLSDLQGRMSQPDFNLASANQEKSAFATLRRNELAGIQNELAVLNLVTAFQNLPEKPPSLALPALEQRGWKLNQAGTDYAVYTRPDFTPALALPFHRITAPGVAPFAICAVEMPLLYASSSRAWSPGPPPEGPQVWVNSGGRAAPASSWIWPAIRQAQNWLRSRPDMASAGEMYPNERSTPGWNTPVTGIPAASAVAVAKTLGGTLPTWTQWRAAATFAQQNRLGDTPHLAGTALTAQMQTVAAVEARLKASSWHRSFFDVPGVGNAIWPDGGSYSPARVHPVGASGGAGDLWFSPVDREAAAAPNRIYDLIGNVAEFVDTETGGFAVVGGSAISSGDWREARAVQANQVFSDVGFRMAVPAAAGEADPLATFRESVRVAAATP